MWHVITTEIEIIVQSHFVLYMTMCATVGRHTNMYSHVYMYVYVKYTCPTPHKYFWLIHAIFQE